MLLSVVFALLSDVVYVVLPRGGCVVEGLFVTGAEIGQGRDCGSRASYGGRGVFVAVRGEISG